MDIERKRELRITVRDKEGKRTAEVTLLATLLCWVCAQEKSFEHIM